MDNLRDIARAQQHIAALLEAPVVPQYDDKGRVIGAKRELPAHVMKARPQSEVMAERVIVAVQGYMTRKLAASDERIAALEKRIATLERERGA